MANRKLKSLKFPGIDDTYILDAGNVNYSDEETYEEGSIGKGLNALKEDIKDNYAKNDGYYDGMTVGNAEQIVGTVFEEDDTAYNYRTTGGSAEVGDRAYVDAITGVSLPWNQMAPTLSSAKWNAHPYLSGAFDSTDNSFSGTVTQQSNSAYISVPNVNGGIEIIAKRVYLYSAEYTPSEALGAPRLGLMYDTQFISLPSISASKTQVTAIFKGADNIGTENKGFYIYPNMSGGMSVDATIKIKNVMVIDLTAMFGSTIADYIYALETAHAGDGVAWFKRYFPKPYYAYHAVGMEHVNAVSARTVGFNQWDEEWELGNLDNSGGTVSESNGIRSKNYCDILPNTTYYCYDGHYSISVYGIRVCFYNANKEFIGATYVSNTTFTTPNDATYFKFATNPSAGTYTTYNHDICFSIRWDNSRDGDYEPYNLHTYPLADITLRGKPLIDESGNLKFDGDRYLPNGTVERRYEDIVFDGSSDENWSLQSINDAGIANFGVSISSNPAKNSDDAICNRFERQNSLISQTTTEGFMIASYTTLYIRISSTKASTVADFRTWLASNPVEVVYLRQTPTEETADPYQYPMVVDNWGTEAFVDGLVESGDRDVAIPVGHETKYPPNLKDKLESAANNPDADGVYVLTHDGGSNTYTPLASNPTIQDIIARLTALEGGGE